MKIYVIIYVAFGNHDVKSAHKDLSEAILQRDMYNEKFGANQYIITSTTLT